MALVSISLFIIGVQYIETSALLGNNVNEAFEIVIDSKLGFDKKIRNL